MPSLPDFRLEKYFSRWEFAARFHLTASDSESWSVQELVALADDDAREQWEHLRLGYSETYGLPGLREAIATTYDTLSAADVLTFAGAEEALYLTMRTLLEPTDHAVVVTPCYQAAETVAASVCEVSGVALDPERGWALDLDDVEAALRPSTRLLAVNFPNNPTGAMPDAATWQRTRRPLRRARHLPVQRRGLPRPRARAARRPSPRRPISRPGPCRSTSCRRRTACQGCASAGSRARTTRCSTGWSARSTTRPSAARRPARCWR